MTAARTGDKDRLHAQAERLRDVWKTPTGWRHLSAVNNAFVGVWYMTGAFAFLLFGGLLALVMRTQLAFPDNDLLSPDLYNQLFTLHGSVMMFLFAIPMFEAFSILLLPQMVAARDLPFPRLSAYSFYCFILGGLFVCGSIFFDAAPAGGWFMYPPLTTAVQTGIGADIWLLGLSFIEIASIAAAVELIVGVLKCRAPGMALHLMPLYCWYILVVGGMILLAFPPLIVGDILLELERAFDWPFFDAARGGDPVLWQHLFWIFGHPEVYIIFLPAVALMAMIVPTFARRPIVGYRWIVLSAVGVGFLSFGLWVHHMYSTGLPGISLGFFSAASEVIAIPTGIQIFVLIATVLAGRVILAVPMLYAAGALAIFVLGGLTGVMIAIVPFDWQAHDSYFIVAHLHYTLIGGMLFPIVGAIYYYFPLIKGKQLSARLGRVAFWLLFAGFNITFLPMHVSGLLGMPRRVYTYQSADGLDTLNLVSTVGAYVIAAGVLLVSWDLLRPKGRQPFAQRNPWNAGTLEWVQEMPGELWGIRTVPHISTRYPLWQQENLLDDIDAGAFYLADAAEGRRESIITTPVDAQPMQCLRLPGPTWKTLFAAAFTGAAFLFATWHQWWLTLAASVLALCTILVWLWTGTAEIPEAERKDIGLGVTVPLYASGSRSVGWWAMFITMIGDLTGFVSLVFGYFYYWTIHSDFPDPSAPGPGLFWPLCGGLAVFVGWLLTYQAGTYNRKDRPGAFYATLILAVVAAGLGAVALLSGPHVYGMDPTAHVYPAIVWLIVIWCVCHLFLGVIMQLYCIARRIAGRMTAQHDVDICNSTLYWHFVLITVAVSVAILAFFPVLS
ncbi:MAG: cytochrome c oxidase subunit I [Woeseiaceae bacterium]